MNEKEVDILNKIFDMATKDPSFRNKLFTEPVLTLKEFEISDRTKRIVIDTIRGMLNQ